MGDPWSRSNKKQRTSVHVLAPATIIIVIRGPKLCKKAGRFAIRGQLGDCGVTYSLVAGEAERQASDDDGEFIRSRGSPYTAFQAHRTASG